MSPRDSESDTAAAIEAADGGCTWITSAGDAVTAIEELESRRRALTVELIDLIGEIDRSGVFLDHGHASAKVMVAHVARLSAAEAGALDKTRRMMARCSHVDRAIRKGEIGVEQMHVLGRVYANPRTRDDFEAKQAWFIAKAKKLSHKRFRQATADWLALHDQDGPEPNDRAHEDRDGALIQDHFTKAWQLRSTQASLHGATMREIWDVYIEAEFQKDWEAAKAIHGDAVTAADLARTDAQRRADAVYQVFLDAAANPNRSAPAKIVHTIVWDQATYHEMLARLAGEPASPFDLDTHRCSTIDGYRIDPTEAFADSLTAEFRRAIVELDSVTIDLSERRFFTGLARTALQLNHDECEWIGCHVPVSRCQADHMVARARGGATDQRNGCNLCRRHNRHKEKGYRVHRDRRTGELKIITPNGELLR